MHVDRSGNQHPGVEHRRTRRLRVGDDDRGIARADPRQRHEPGRAQPLLARRDQQRLGQPEGHGEKAQVPVQPLGLLGRPADDHHRPVQPQQVERSGGPGESRDPAVSGKPLERWEPHLIIEDRDSRVSGKRGTRAPSRDRLKKSCCFCQESLIRMHSRFRADSGAFSVAWRVLLREALSVGASENRRASPYRSACVQMQHNQSVFHQGERAMRFVKSLFVVLAAVLAIAVAREARAQQLDPYVSCVRCHALPMQQALAEMQGHGSPVSTGAGVCLHGLPRHLESRAEPSAELRIFPLESRERAGVAAGKRLTSPATLRLPARASRLRRLPVF